MTLAGLGHEDGDSDWNNAAHMASESITTHRPRLDSLVLAECGGVCDLVGLRLSDTCELGALSLGTRLGKSGRGTADPE